MTGKSLLANLRLRTVASVAAGFVALMVPGAGGARIPGDPAQICDQVALVAAEKTGVPLSVLKAISLTETGRKRGGRFRPWPWTINMEGEGHWFDSKEEARAYVDKEFARGARSFDIGCFQINYKWHGENFASIDEMFDPMANALYAARLLGQLYAETGHWGRAAGAYHSRTQKFAERYQARFERIRTPLMAEDGADIPEIPDIVLAANGPEGGDAPLPVPRVNRYPLLRGGFGVALGSLVPLTGRTSTPLYGAAATAVE
ncbi:MAG TPA: transglycosylase SLT domain-containing protein [Albidovulum sp.]|uniref:transglycosylase SLT domain-containing protein n=1 Tax=Albidovulum sp. TaxID=1872424 RepID=UPI002C3E4B7C|nr:transglycosylase SLT domain-containing protein [Albidovulum sp.]